MQSRASQSFVHDEMQQRVRYSKPHRNVDIFRCSSVVLGSELVGDVVVDGGKRKGNMGNGRRELEEPRACAYTKVLQFPNFLIPFASNWDVLRNEAICTSSPNSLCPLWQMLSAIDTFDVWSCLFPLDSCKDRPLEKASPHIPMLMTVLPWTRFAKARLSLVSISNGFTVTFFPLTQGSMIFSCFRFCFRDA